MGKSVFSTVEDMTLSGNTRMMIWTVDMKSLETFVAQEDAFAHIERLKMESIGKVSFNHYIYHNSLSLKQESAHLLRQQKWQWRVCFNRLDSQKGLPRLISIKLDGWNFMSLQAPVFESLLFSLLMIWSS